MATTTSAAAATPSEQMFFEGAHLAHVIAYYEHLRLLRIERNWERFRSVRRIDERVFERVVA
jgi:hypothetical protein